MTHSQKNYNSANFWSSITIFGSLFTYTEDFGSFMEIGVWNICSYYWGGWHNGELKVLLVYFLARAIGHGGYKVNICPTFSTLHNYTCLDNSFLMSLCSMLSSPQLKFYIVAWFWFGKFVRFVNHEKNLFYFFIEPWRAWLQWDMAKYFNYLVILIDIVWCFVKEDDH